ncbi:CpaF/VirB11 family protein [Halolactibacillus sp. JCM 19043]|uniref:CpaF/VirB11 family protein n=1 Tax=Halolactibacillus sp. JCM 19043 TaxID=1460638 RepID=UPI000783A572|nr:CpaF/VirB11 family protein [Halolactibacillus sp. JCM 19043]
MISHEILQEIKKDLKEYHSELYLESFVNMDAREVLKRIVKEKHQTILKDDERLNYVVSEIVGLGVIDDIISKDETVTDVSYNGTSLIVETPNEKYEHESVIEEDYINQIIQKFANAVGKEFTPKSPILDAALNNLRINAVHRSISSYGTTMAIRVSRPVLALNHSNFDNFAPEYMLEFFEAAVASRCNIVIAGETGTGKTEFQKFLTSFIPFNEKIGWIEDTLEGHVKELFPEKDIISWLVTPSTNHSTLIKAMLRNNPTWINVSETRGEEAYEMIQAVLSGHHIITTAHTVNAKAIPTRFINMAKMGYAVDEKSLERDIFRYFQLGVFIKKKRIKGKMIRFLSEVVFFLDNGQCHTIFETIEEDDDLNHRLHTLPVEFADRLKEFNLQLSNVLRKNQPIPV